MNLEWEAAKVEARKTCHALKMDMSKSWEKNFGRFIVSHYPLWDKCTDCGSSFYYDTIHNCSIKRS